MIVRAELRKLRGVTAPKVAIGVGLVGLLITQGVLVTLLPAMASGAFDTGGELSGAELGLLDPGSTAFQAAALDPLGGGPGGLGSVSVTTIAVMVLGLLVATTDERFGGSVLTALARPRRLQVLAGKTAATALVAAGLAAVFAAVCLASLLLVTTVVPGSGGLALGGLEVAGTLVRGAAVVVLTALLGLGIGVLVRNQLAGVLVVIALLVLEPVVQGVAQLVTGTLPVWAQLLPSSLGRAATAPGAVGLALPSGVALAVLAVLVAAVLGAAGAAMQRRDV